MYGLVNKAVQDYVTSKFGEAVWNTVRTKAGFHDAEFVPLQAYPDELTFRMVGAACETTGMAAAELVEQIGAYWVAFTGRQGYGSLMDQLGSDFAEALANLDAMHVRVALMMPNLKPPSFRVLDQGERRLTLAYVSKREGLVPMVIGLVKGLGHRYGLEPVVTLQKAREPGGDTDVFDVRW